MANLDKPWQECSLDEALQKVLKEFNSIKNSGCNGNKIAENGPKINNNSCDKPSVRPSVNNFFRNFLLQN